MPVGTRLGEFEIRRVLGVGGFGIVYLAFDHLLEREVALKEYMPATLVDRNETLHVSLVSQEHADTFALGLRSFVNEARLLARFDHPSLVKVHRFWEANGTAYMAMALYKGRNARDVRAKLGTPADEAWVRSMVEPLLGAIERLHSEDVYHRDIAPDNIMIEPDGRPVLLDFGAARRVITDRSQALTAILKPSYAPIEQYADVSGMKQGPWTDIYALGATMHFLLLGKPPPPAPGRSIQDTMKPLASQALPGCTPEFLAVIDWMLAPLPTERPQTVAAVRDALAGRTKAPQRTPPSPFERTAAIEGLGNEDATVIVPRGAPPPKPTADEDATVVIPRSAMAPPPRPAPGDEDATIISPRSSAFWIPPESPPPAPPAPAPAPKPAAQAQAAPGARPHTTQYAPRALAEQGAEAPTPAPRRVAEDRPPPVTPKASASVSPNAAPRAAAASSSSWLTPVIAGVVAAAVIGGGLWWFLTRPAAETPLANASPATAPEPAPAPSPAPAPAVAEPTPAAATISDAASAAATVAPTPSPAPAPVVAPAPNPAPPAADSRRPAPPPAASPRATEPAPRRTEPAPQPRTNTAGPTTSPPQSQGTQTQPAPRQAQTQAPVPSPAPAPAPTADAVPPADDRPRSPSERCAKELPLVRLICIDLTCNRSEFSKHPECVNLRAEQAQKRRLDGN
jgi:serine/threonine protein kinase